MANKERFIITLVSVTLIIIHMFCPNLTVDGITITLIIIASLPWLIKYIRTLELPGGIKMELTEQLATAQEKVEKAGLLLDGANTKERNVFIVDYNDPIITLAALRIEIEKKLKLLVNKHGIVDPKRGLKSILTILRTNEMLNSDEIAALDDLIGVLNRAVHSEDVPKTIINWAINIGPKLLNALDSKIEQSNK